MISYGPNYSSGYSASSPLITTTFANKPAPGPVGSQVYISDVGEYGAIYTSNGTSWTHSGEIEIIQKAKGWIVPSLAAADAATYSQSGTIITVTSIGHNIPAANYDTKDVYLNMGTAATGATIPPGWFSNFQRTGVDTFTCVSTVSQTGTGAVNTNIGLINTPDLTSIIKGNVLGLNGNIKYSILGSNNNSVSNKYIQFIYGPYILYPLQNTTVTYSSITDERISNRNSNTSKVTTILGLIFVFDVDSTIDQTCSFSLQCTSANDYVAIHSASLYINKS
jgi:hypothetical protein